MAAGFRHRRGGRRQNDGGVRHEAAVRSGEPGSLPRGFEGWPSVVGVTGGMLRGSEHRGNGALSFLAPLTSLGL